MKIRGLSQKIEYFLDGYIHERQIDELAVVSLVIVMAMRVFGPDEHKRSFPELLSLAVDIMNAFSGGNQEKFIKIMVMERRGVI
jgi:hypothetical protein